MSSNLFDNISLDIKEGDLSDYYIKVNQIQRFLDKEKENEKLLTYYKSLIPEERYEKDPWFHNLVNSFSSLIETGTITAVELKEVTRLAVNLYHDKLMNQQ